MSNLSEEEKEAIEKFKNIIYTYQDVIDEEDWYSYEEIESAKEYQEVAEKILDILNKQQKEIEELKEENLHLKGQYYLLSRKINKPLEDKIKEEIKELDEMNVDGEVFTTAVNFAKKILQELLGEENE